MQKLMLITLIIASFDIYAIDFVYRVDSNPPDIIFRDGFSLLGYNRDLQELISGESCAGGSSDSRYITMTSDINQTYAIARSYYSRSAFKGNLYRYKIRADNNFYSLIPSVSYLESKGGHFNAHEKSIIRLQSEYVSVLSILPGNIQKAVALVYDSATGQIKDGASTINDNYLSISSESNPGVIPFLPEPQINAMQRIDVFGSLISSCFSIYSVCQTHRGRKTEVYKMPFYDARPVIQIITSDK
ncbi:pertussis-like toxin subunit ArtA [Salmonella enterica]|uniref:pertussis-like toxin subunit ArtA n=1 Tax=Salmonella enterica TaxID=28901 RepID=UPI002ACDDB29|nr:pertussis-like toxin subunit ArtA [Salmonella enterica]WQF97820.1 pertussis-like toxin subunit ArtA [Salmonella enterica subsp. enterica serovar Abortusovis]WQG02229.1 pertussis-like toxin subunit ArtA [Salmonella enterica subsp. enterica serovar Abortusovis]WQG06685.1 pertussis-like toxin subunit ArtA [Salmonella enterica subsp. enterica serovar Abortusovis]WQG11248.1 pertussis-like toxin subunit ArtA [Salmonella enterica subsp. enterica serovar Abortusovis]HCT0246236.1 pertussis-like toxi